MLEPADEPPPDFEEWLKPDPNRVKCTYWSMTKNSWANYRVDENGNEDGMWDGDTYYHCTDCDRRFETWEKAKAHFPRPRKVFYTSDN